MVLRDDQTPKPVPRVWARGPACSQGWTHRVRDGHRDPPSARATESGLELRGQGWARGPACGQGRTHRVAMTIGTQGFASPAPSPSPNPLNPPAPLTWAAAAAACPVGAGLFLTAPRPTSWGGTEKGFQGGGGETAERKQMARCVIRSTQPGEGDRGTKRAGDHVRKQSHSSHRDSVSDSGFLRERSGI